MSVRVAWWVFVGTLLAFAGTAAASRELAQWLVLPVLYIVARAVGVIERDLEGRT